jgi:ribosomal-protein-alanine N-acetyltransferase
MVKIILRYQQIGDAKKFWKILNDPEFTYFSPPPGTITEEKNFLRRNHGKRKQNIEHNFSILVQGEVVGAIGVTIDQRRPHIGEISYFIDKKHWGKGIASRSVTMIEEFIAKELGLYRIEIMIMTKNIKSIRVAEKCGYRKEGIQKGKIKVGLDYVDAYSFGKLLTNQAKRSREE